MATTHLIAVFDDRSKLEQAVALLKRLRLAEDHQMYVESLESSEEDDSGGHEGLLKRLKGLLGRRKEHHAPVYAESVRRGSMLLVVSVPEDKADGVRDVLRTNGAVDLKRRVRRWVSSGWNEPAAVAYIEEEIDENATCISEDTPSVYDDNTPPRPIRLFDEEAGRDIGKISEAELAVLQDALEEEGPDDNDYWINEDEIDDLACRPVRRRT